MIAPRPERKCRAEVVRPSLSREQTSGDLGARAHPGFAGAVVLLPSPEIRIANVDAAVS